MEELASRRALFEPFSRAPRPLPLAERIEANRAVFRASASRRIVVEPTVRRTLRSSDGNVRGFVSSLTVDYAGVRTRGTEIVSEPSFRTSVEPPSIPIYPAPPEPNAGLDHRLFVRFDAFSNSRGELVIVGSVAVDPFGEIYPAIAVHPGKRA